MTLAKFIDAATWAALPELDVDEGDDLFSLIAGGTYRLVRSDEASVVVAGLSVPDTFVSPANFTVSNGGDGTSIDVVIGSLPANTPFTDIEYRIDAGTATSFGAATSGSYSIMGLTTDVEIGVQIRGVNSGGNGDWSTEIDITPTVATSLIDQYIFDDTTDSFGATMSGPGDLYIAYHADSYAPVDTQSNAEAIIAGTDVNIIETQVVNTQQLGEESLSLLYSTSVGVAGDVVGFSLVLDADTGGASNIITQTFTINEYVETLVGQTSDGFLEIASDIAPDGPNNLIAASFEIDNADNRQNIAGTEDDRIMIGQWNNTARLRIVVTGDNGAQTIQNVGATADGDRINLFIADEVVGSDLQVTAYWKKNAEAWAQLWQTTLVGAQGLDLSGPFRLFRNHSGVRGFSGGLAHFAFWTGLASPVDPSSATIQDKWAKSDGTIENPGLLIDDLGSAPIQTFGGSSFYTDGENQGNLGEFETHGDFVTYE